MDAPAKRPAKGPIGASARLKWHLGKQLHIPAWALAVVGGGLAAPLGSLAIRIRALGEGAIPLALVGLAIYGAAVGVLAGITAGLVRPRLVVHGVIYGLLAGAACAAAASIAYPIIIAGFALTAALPALVVARGLRLGKGPTVTIAALSLMLVSAFGVPAYTLSVQLNPVVGANIEVLYALVAAIAGGASWLRPAIIRVGGPLN